MPGADDRWDQLAEPYARNQEAALSDRPRIADRPKRGSLVDLRQRLERLPPGHPSSPYNDDMTPKAPVPRLKDLELPVRATTTRDTANALSSAQGYSLDSAPSTASTPAGSQNGAGGPGGITGEPATGGPATAEPATGEPATGEFSIGDFSTGEFATPGWSSTSDEESPADGLDTDDSLDITDSPDVGDSPDPGDVLGTDDSFSVSDSLGADDTLGTNDSASPLTVGDALGGRRPAAAPHDLGSEDELANGLGSGADLGTANGFGTGHRFDDDVSAHDRFAAASDGARPAADFDLDLGAGSGLGRGGDLGPEDGRDDPPKWFDTGEWNTDGWSASPGRGRITDHGPADHAGADRGGAAEPRWAQAGPATDTLSHDIFVAESDSDEPLLGTDGSWRWHGRYLSPQEGQAAEQALGRCRIAEGRNVFGSYGHSGLTPAMRRIEAQLEHGDLVPGTESYALKPRDSFKERFADLMLRHPDKSVEELSYEVHDAIRYTFIFDPENYADGTLQVHSRLKGHGFELEVRWNGWDSPEYKGVNSRWRDPAHDLAFEVRFHTAASWDVWQRGREAYKQITDPVTSPPERMRLRAMHAKMSAAVPVPPGCAAIPDFRKESA
jgi:hypothetical protein